MLLRPLTGRRHQLRVHCLCLGHPIGDRENREKDGRRKDKGGEGKRREEKRREEKSRVEKR